MTKKEVEEVLQHVKKKYNVEVDDEKLWLRAANTYTIELRNIYKINASKADIWIFLNTNNQTITLSLHSNQIHTSL
jgi:hypothetical protein